MPTEQAANPLLQLPIIPYILIFGIFYFLVLRPQKEKQKKQKEMLSNIKKNDPVVSSGGIHGTVTLVKEKTIIVRVDDNVKIEFDKDVITVVAKGKS